MSSPYIIWTLRRTGGTTLAGLLATLSEHPGVEHEPFNAERVFGEVVRGWKADPDPERLKAHMAEVLAPRPVIKHCHELLPHALNRALARVSTRMGYVHVVLDRQAEVDRILSLELARQTGAWGRVEAWRVFEALQSGERQIGPIDIPEALQHLRFCMARRRVLRGLFDKLGIVPFEVLFEEVYGAPEIGREKVRALLDFIGIDPGGFPDYEAQLTEALLRKGQNSARLMDFVPNIAAARRKLLAAAETGRPQEALP